MPETTREIALSMLVHTLEQMAFLAVAPPPDSPHPVPEQPLYGTIQCVGDLRGSVELIADRRLAEIVAANILAANPGDPEVLERALDVFCELLNVTAGAILRHPDAKAGQSRMQLPSAKPIDREEWTDLMHQDGFQVIDAESLPIAIRWNIAA